MIPSFFNESVPVEPKNMFANTFSLQPVLVQYRQNMRGLLFLQVQNSTHGKHRAVKTVTIFWFLFGLSSCITVEDFVTIEVDFEGSGDETSCLFVSKETIWPFEDGDFSTNYAQDNCKELGMDLAVLENPQEATALQELTSYSLEIKFHLQTKFNMIPFHFSRMQNV